MSPPTFTEALTRAEAQARSTLVPALHERLADAVTLVKDGRVFQATDGTWQVDSSSREGGAQCEWRLLVRRRAFSGAPGAVQASLERLSGASRVPAHASARTRECRSYRHPGPARGTV
jgi:hypothetical protein